MVLSFHSKSVSVSVQIIHWLSEAMTCYNVSVGIFLFVEISITVVCGQ